MSYFELDLVAFLQRLEAITFNRFVMDKDVIALFSGDESITLLTIKPLYSSSFHELFLLLKKT